MKSWSCTVRLIASSRLARDHRHITRLQATSSSLRAAAASDSALHLSTSYPLIPTDPTLFPHSSSSSLPPRPPFSELIKQQWNAHLESGVRALTTAKFSDVTQGVLSGVEGAVEGVKSLVGKLEGVAGSDKSLGRGEEKKDQSGIVRPS